MADVVPKPPVSHLDQTCVDVVTKKKKNLVATPKTGEISDSTPSFAACKRHHDPCRYQRKGQNLTRIISLYVKGEKLSASFSSSMY